MWSERPPTMNYNITTIFWNKKANFKKLLEKCLYSRDNQYILISRTITIIVM